MAKKNEIVPASVKMISTAEIQSMIHVVRGERVILDRDLAILYGVETKNLKRQVKRNINRFPSDFMIELTREEYDSLWCQNGTLEHGRGEHSKYLPFAFLVLPPLATMPLQRNIKRKTNNRASCIVNRQPISCIVHCQPSTVNRYSAS